MTHVDASGERTITVLGARLEPRAADPLPWDELRASDAVYATAGDAEALRIAREARVLVATARILPALAAAGVELDALVGSARDPAEAYGPGDLSLPPRLIVRTDGARGGTFEVRGERARRYDAAPPPGPLVDSYGCGDAFAAALTYALGCEMPPVDAVAFAARCGAAVATGRGPYAAMRGGGDE